MAALDGLFLLPFALRSTSVSRDVWSPNDCGDLFVYHFIEALLTLAFVLYFAS
jgi:hypothetical protein